MRPLIIDDKIKEEAKAVLQYSLVHKYDVESITRRAKGIDSVPGNNPMHSIEIEVGYRAVFSIDEDPNNGWVKHISISVAAKDKLPSPHACDEICKLFGMNMENGFIFPHPTEGTIRVVEKLNTDP